MKSMISTAAALVLLSSTLMGCTGSDSGSTYTSYGAPSSTSFQSTARSVIAAPSAKVSRALGGGSSQTAAGDFALTSNAGASFSIPVNDDDSYMNAAMQAMDRCSKTGKKPTAPTQKIENGQTVLAYGCS